MAAEQAREPMTAGARHAFAALAAVVALVAAAGPVFTVVYANSTAARQDAQARVQARTIAVQDKVIARLDAAVAQLRTQQLAGCAFAADIGSLPLPARPRASRALVSLVADSRAEWRGLHCPGTLPAPSPGLAKWAKFYRLPAS